MIGNNAISGLFSGIDSLTLVDQLINVERRPAYLMESQKAKATIQLASYDALKQGLTQLKSFMDLLRRPQDFRDMTGRVSHYDIMNAQASQGAQAGSYSMVVENLAQSHQVSSQGFAAADSAIGTGTVSVSVGGEELLSVEVTAGNNTLEGLADAINDAGTGVSAAVLNTGNGANPYQLVISNGDTGVANMLSLSSDLSGGTNLNIGTVDAVVVGTQAGSSAVTSGGHYTGGSDATFSFTVTTGGTVGADTISIDWTNDQGQSGTVTLDDTYVPGTEIEVFGSMLLSFGAGDLQASDDWSVDATSGTVQAAQDAKITFGSGNPITVYNSDNTVTNLIGGVTLNLLRADPAETVTVTVGRDTAGIMSRLDGFVKEYNNLVTFVKDQMSYNEDTGSAGLFLGDTTAIRLDSRIRGAVSRSVTGIGGAFTNLIDIGIGTSASGTLDTDGLLTIETGTLRDALEDDLAGVISLLAGTGVASDSDIEFLNAGYLTTPTGSNPGYDVFITQAATQGGYAGGRIAEPSGGSPFVIDSSNDMMKLKVDGIVSGDIELTAGSYADGDSLAVMIESRVNSDSTLGSRDIAVEWIDDGGGEGHLQMTSKSYGGNSAIFLETPDENSAHADLGLTAGNPLAGRDVEGYYEQDGVQFTASGSGRILTGDQEGSATEGLSILVKMTDQMLASQGEAQGSVGIYSGVTDRLNRILDEALELTTGTIAVKQESLQRRVDDLKKQVDRFDDRLQIRRDRYIDEFIRMEALIAEFQSSSSAFTSMLAQVPKFGSVGNSNR